MSPRAGLDGCKNPGFYTGNVQLAASRFINKQTVQQTSRNILLLEKLTVAQLLINMQTKPCLTFSIRLVPFSSIPFYLE